MQIFPLCLLWGEFNVRIIMAKVQQTSKELKIQQSKAGCGSIYTHCSMSMTIGDCLAVERERSASRSVGSRLTNVPESRKAHKFDREGRREVKCQAEKQTFISCQETLFNQKLQEIEFARLMSSLESRARWKREDESSEKRALIEFDDFLCNWGVWERRVKNSQSFDLA